MKFVKRLIYIVLITIFSLIFYTNMVKAATVKVTTETLFLREKASTSSSVLTMIGEDEKCELLGEEGDWYKVKYKTYTGYISKDYATKEGEEKKQDSVDTKNETKGTDDNKEDASNKKTNDAKETEENVANENDAKEAESANPSETTVQNVVGKMKTKTPVKILPLIQSSEIDTLNKNENVTIIDEINGWSYIQNDEIAGWVRSDTITKTANTTTQKEEDKNTAKKETSGDANNKEMYVNDDNVNIRAGASTDADIIMAVDTNTKLTVIGEEGDWYKVKTSAGNAYISKQFLSAEKQTTTRGKVVRGATENLSESAKKELTSSTKKKTSTSSSTTSKKTNTSSSSKGSEIVAYAKKFLGVPYVYGGASSKGFDCSGYTMYVYDHFNISLPHGAEKQSHYGTRIKADKSSASSLKSKLKAGDIIFFLDYETMDEIGHCGIYIGDGKFIHASSGSGYCVKIDSLLPGQYYNTRYCGATRLI